MSEIINYEVKSRCVSITAIREYLKNISAKFIGEDHQVDYYFNVPQGRLKYRKGNVENSLIYYERENTSTARESKIQLERLTTDSNMHKVLGEALGIKIIVDKKREIYFINNVKIHLDTIIGLGEFVEIEAIDDKAEFSTDELKEQCEHFISEFKLKTKDFIELSYSDLIAENFEQKFYREAQNFVYRITSNIEKTDLKLSKSFMDHLCYRVSSVDEYSQTKTEFEKLGELLVESIVGGRNIATYKLNRPIVFNERSVDVIELPEPKASNKYATGFEHAEFVIEEDLNVYARQHSQAKWDTDALGKSINPDIRLKFSDGSSIKLHNQSLEAVIEYEKALDK